jgi:hypothetical protein
MYVGWMRTSLRSWSSRFVGPSRAAVEQQIWHSPYHTRLEWVILPQRVRPCGAP